MRLSEAPSGQRGPFKGVGAEKGMEKVGLVLQTWEPQGTPVEPGKGHVWESPGVSVQIYSFMVRGWCGLDGSPLEDMVQS